MWDAPTTSRQQQETVLVEAPPEALARVISAAGVTSIFVTVSPIKSFEPNETDYMPDKEIEKSMPGKSFDDFYRAVSSNPKFTEKFKKTRQRFSDAFLNGEKPTFIQLRLAAGMSQQELASKSGLEQYQISKLECGYNLSRSNYFKVWKALDADPQHFLEAMGN